MSISTPRLWALISKWMFPFGLWHRSRVFVRPTDHGVKKSKRICVYKKICLSKCFSEIEMPGELLLGPGQPENDLQLFLHSSNDGNWYHYMGHSGKLNCEKPQLSKDRNYLHLRSTSKVPYNLLHLLSPANYATYTTTQLLSIFPDLNLTQPLLQ